MIYCLLIGQYSPDIVFLLVNSHSAVYLLLVILPIGQHSKYSLLIGQYSKYCNLSVNTLFSLVKILQILHSDWSIRTNNTF